MANTVRPAASTKGQLSLIHVVGLWVELLVGAETVNSEGLAVGELLAGVFEGALVVRTVSLTVGEAVGVFGEAVGVFMLG
eukprot:CAMPEP_0203759142 /NCGR_PEP_ID=MMETSP0098-20131031/12100_1 /ASSEMBLY_ACC=CAM_ASM_000208 /TAXON_ID=96639 /ORGANISM=" , Strain NY0313808BC1" /LENGTH=79 /DNA_ID=CAMNT_0050651919 /DNA_START=86 /DNA_END=321 /DNA_ORIENTATION=+